MRINRDLLNRSSEILQIATEHGARNVHVFGSVARGDANPNSDLDLLVQLSPESSLLDLIAIKQDLADLLGCKVDVVTEAALSPYIHEQVLMEATPL